MNKMPQEPDEGEAAELGIGLTRDELERLLFPYVSTEDQDVAMQTGGGLSGFAFMYTDTEQQELVLYLVTERDGRTKRFLPAALVPLDMFDDLTRCYPFLGHVYETTFATTAELYRITTLQQRMTAKLREQNEMIKALQAENSELRATVASVPGISEPSDLAKENARMLAWIKRANLEQQHFFPQASAHMLSLGQRITGMRKKFKDCMTPLTRLSKEPNAGTKATANMLILMMRHQTEETAGIATQFEELHALLEAVLQRYDTE